MAFPTRYGWRFNDAQDLGTRFKPFCDGVFPCIHSICRVPLKESANSLQLTEGDSRVEDSSPELTKQRPNRLSWLWPRFPHKNAYMSDGHLMDTFNLNIQRTLINVVHYLSCSWRYRVELSQVLLSCTAMHKVATNSSRILNMSVGPDGA